MLTLQQYDSYLSCACCCRAVLFACQITPSFLLRRTKKKNNFIQSRQAQERSRARSLISAWPRRWEGSDQDLSLSSLNQAWLFSLFPIHTGAGWVWLRALSLCACTMPGILSNNGKKIAFLGVNKSFWKCFQAFRRTVWKYPISICRFSLLFLYMLLSSTTTNRYYFLLNSFGSKILRISGFVSSDLGGCHSLTHVRL